MRVFAALLIVLCLALGSLPAAALDLSGRLTQGGLALGHTVPGATVALDGRAVPVDGQGRFVVGFGRDAPARVALTVTRPDGSAETRRLAIAPVAWPEQHIDGLPPAQVTPDPERLKRIRAEAELIRQARAIDTPEPRFLAGMIRPVEGTVSGVFGSRRILNGEPRAPHSGLDIAAPAGTPVKAAAAGTVTLVHDDMFYTGGTVMIDHGQGVATVYAHLARVDVGEGQPVGAGAPIGTVGASGRATGPHLHFGVSWWDVRLDPEAVLAVLAPPEAE
ncbi:M23 family metallopeptidase [Roseospirillum parvum]|uniref:Murein DD-endopeptidase MepM and murein hydrolase activator NlpD, contain LysM domain n=1 Tax=Roseospirillum parvum TaxID=83401 RepID=A0A1G7UIA0_9PROT|nr:M23 family metallopeptidase [Roseospirillum parvum]SDG47234.1 Murein DD-endopeptidase MepM and murein hydrolase activator NlpD, contain LysM domain [Roseospirillum parvum]